ncbi:MAG: helicase HerA-like domain-containing protein [Bacteroidota bacterium]
MTAIKEKFIETIKSSYTFKGNSILLGSAVLGDDQDTGCQIRIPLKTMNRHGLIAGATGTGKTKTLQVIAEELSLAGVPTLVMDIKGDLSGIAASGSMNPIIEKRSAVIGMDWKATAFPSELMTISNEHGVRLKATVSEFGPMLLAKILDLNDNQTGVLSMIFKYCDNKGLPLLDIQDLKTVIRYIQEDGKADFLKDYGYFQTASAGTILRNITSLEQQGANLFFGEPSFDIFDLMKTGENGLGKVNILRVVDIQSNTAIFSTFMLCLLAEIFQKMPERGDAEQPELIIFFDEAHLIFRNASKTLMDQFETTIKLIRSKGVGIFLVTQSPDDIPASILGQLGLKVQHSLRAFTAKDRKAIKAAAENYPLSDFYKADELITMMGTGEAMVTALDEKGRPTQLVHTLIRPPLSRMDILSDGEIGNLINTSRLVRKYNKDIDRESAHEMLMERIEEQQEEIARQESAKASRKQAPATRTARQTGMFEKIMKSPVTNTIAREVTRGLLGVLGLKAAGSIARSATTRKTTTRKR